MAEFLIWREGFLLMLVVLALLALAGQVLAAILSGRLASEGRIPWIPVVWEWTLVSQTALLVLLSTEFHSSAYEVMIVPERYGTLRVATPLLILLCALVMIRGAGRLSPLLSAAVAALTPLQVERAARGGYPVLFIFMIMFFLLRAVYQIIRSGRNLQRNLSHLSVKRAIDEMQNGILLYDHDRMLVLVNNRMRQLTARLYGKPLHRGERFDGLPQVAPEADSPLLASFENDHVYRFDGDEVWMFSSRPVDIRGKPYTQITAADMTDRWRLITELENKEEQLLQARRRLEAGINQLQAVRRAEVLRSARSQVHDLMAQRISLLQQLLLRRERPDQALLERISDDLLSKLREPPEAADPRQELRDLQSVFGEIGVEVRLDGDLPQDSEHARLAVDIARECVNNAVKHGFASAVAIRFTPAEEESELEISNNGILPAGTIREGQGIRGMRERLARIGGHLEIVRAPRFVVRAAFPGESD